MNNICIIPARGGSKRIPKKNIKHFLNKPIISYTIKVALNSKLFDEVMVSTDDNLIAEIALKYGAKVPFKRSKKNSNDYATTFDVLNEVLKDYKKNNLTFNNVCCIYPCSPFLTTDTLNKAFKLLNENKFDSVFPIVSYSTPIQRALKLTGKKVKMINDNYLNTRSQDLEQSYYDAGQFYWCKVQKLLKNKKIFAANSGGLKISELDAQDIDTIIDWKLAELKYKLKSEVS